MLELMQNDQPMTPPQKLIEFNMELKALLEKYNFVLGAVAFIRPDGGIAARPEVFDKPQPSTDEGVKLTPTDEEAKKNDTTSEELPESAENTPVDNSVTN